MDNLTHTATGLFLSRAGLHFGVPHAAWIMVLAANAPDIDVASLAGGSISYLGCHRNITHSLPLLPVMALLPILLVRLVTRKPLPWRRAYVVSLIGLGSHLALDLTNMYGVRLLAPIRERWFQLDIFSVVDLWIWAVILFALAGPFVARLVNAEIGARRKPPVRGFAIFALVFLVLYAAGRGVLHERAVAVLDARLYEGAVPLRVAAQPRFANPLAWRGLVETSEFYSVHDIELLGSFDPSRGRRFYKPEAGPEIEAALRTRTMREFLRFAQYPLWRVSPNGDAQPGTRVEAFDMRFGTPLDPGFMAAVILDERLNPVRESFTFGRPR
ncbi:MAG TPA: metal-dependent hydrolase [Bryobacteraceae bacterium]|nr:metal-dependent hydrolase [Bryobacteraceae bacterium]